MKALEPLVGTWSVVMRSPSEAIGELRGTTRFEWILGGAYLLATSTIDDPVPDAHVLVARDGDAYVQHYFDARGVIREYAMTYGDGVWTLARDPEPPGFAQRSIVTLGDDVMTGRWDRVEDGEWVHDFDISYTRAG